MRQRHPAERDVVWSSKPRGLPRALGVREDVAVGQHDALRLAGRARRELDERRVVRRQLRRRAGARDVVELLDQERARLQRRPGLRLADGRRRMSRGARAASVRVQERRAELPRDAQQLVLVLVADADARPAPARCRRKAGPVRVDELLVAGDVQDQLVALASRRCAAGGTGCRARAGAGRESFRAFSAPSPSR